MPGLTKFSRIAILEKVIVTGKVRLFLMNWLNKLERKLGRYAIPNLIVWLIGAYTIGFVLYAVNPGIMSMLTLSPYHILHGQVWRLVTWIFMPTETNLIFLLIMALFYYQLGTVLERNWGTFRFNVYIFSGIIFTIIGAFVLYAVYYVLHYSAFSAVPGLLEQVSSTMGYGFSVNYINMSIFLAFAVMYPNMQVMLYFIIPIKMKWMAVVYAVLIGYHLIAGSWPVRVSIVMSLFSFVVFFLSTRNLKRYAPHEIRRRQTFKAQMREPRPGSGITKHKCAVCGRTELDDPSLEFRFCSKCEGNYEYCSDHLFTHQHIRRS